MNAFIQKPLGFTMGDAAGIGPELICKLFAQGLPAPALVYGDVQTLETALSALGIKHIKVRLISSIQDFTHQENVMAVIQCGAPIRDLVLGQISSQAGETAYQSLIKAIDDASAQHLHAVVTAPLHKVSLKKAGYDFPGHTEILAWRSQAPFVGMMLLNDELRVMLVTIHVALQDVPKLITPESEEQAIRLAHLACQQLGLSQARVAVSGLNPHAGEDGRFGQEERLIIEPVIKRLQAQGINVSGPYPGDTVFMRARQGEFDIVVAQYHDQGLIPVKYMGLDNGVNVTVGLPFIRTSVDHGTAFDIAGQGIADPSSLLTAFNLALKMHISS